MLTYVATAVAAGCVAWGAVRALAFGEQQPARLLITFGAIALAVGVWSIFDARR